ncbi:MAG TPA: polysaccharide deacetylase family protein [Panacibacter sp.]|nr:polysaccharide deacetylase family protein [Panacibacter sp.]HNP42882.1 polysaccharide deacetylase family protein [Panacibacter sp.]
MNTILRAAIFYTFITGIVHVSYAQSTSKVPWPKGKEAAISLSFDDARFSQVDRGTALLDSMQVKATFYLVPAAAEQRMEGWKKAVAAGHEMGNHSLFHPCSGNFEWSRNHALENYTLDSMRYELVESNNRIEKMLGVKPIVFAYPCGQKFVGRGVNTKSYVPLIAEMFITGRGFMEETPNDPAYVDFAQITGIEMDGKDFEQLLPMIEAARKKGQWVVLAGHEMADDGVQTTRLAMLRKLIAYVKDPANKMWVAPVGEVAKYISGKRAAME